MTDTTPPRYKDREDLTVDEQLAVQQARHRGEPAPQFETDDYKQARREALTDAGLEPAGDNDAEPTPIEDMTPEQHLERIKRHH